MDILKDRYHDLLENRETAISFLVEAEARKYQENYPSPASLKSFGVEEFNITISKFCELEKIFNRQFLLGDIKELVTAMLNNGYRNVFFSKIEDFMSGGSYDARRFAFCPLNPLCCCKI